MANCRVVKKRRERAGVSDRVVEGGRRKRGEQKESYVEEASDKGHLDGCMVVAFLEGGFVGVLGVGGVDGEIAKHVGQARTQQKGGHGHGAHRQVTTGPQSGIDDAGDEDPVEAVYLGHEGLREGGGEGKKRQKA